MSNRRQIDECNDPTVIIVPPEERPDLITIYGVVDLWLGQTDFDNYDPMVGVYALDSEGNDVTVICTLASQTADEKVYAYLASNATYTATATRHVYLWGAPTITAYDRTIYQGDRTFDPLENVTAVDVKGNPVPVTVSGYYDVDTPGTYNLIYIANSKGFSASVTKTLTVLPWSNPIIHCPLVTEITERDPFDPMENVTAEDCEGNDLTNDVTYTSNVNTDVPGTYYVDYTVYDSLGRKGTARQTVVVKPSQYQTVLFSDGTLIINEDKDNLQSDILTHGAVLKTYIPGVYDFHSSSEVPWTNERGLIQHAEFGSEFRPESLAFTFYGCNNMESVDLRNLITDDCVNFSEMFSNCFKLKAVDATRINVSNAETMHAMFLDCWALKVLDLSTWNTANCTDFSAMFYDCVELRTIYASEYFVTTEDPYSTRSMFAICQNLTGGMGTEYNSAYIDWQRAYIDEGTTRPGYFTDKTKLVSTVFEDGTLVVNEPYGDRQRDINLHGNVVHQYAPCMDYNNWEHNWAGDTYIKKVEFRTPIQPTTMSGWFAHCTGIEEIDWTNVDSSECTDMSSMLNECSSLQVCDLSMLDTSKVEDFSGTFRAIRPFEGFMDYVNAWDTSSATNMAGMFMGIKGMTSIAPAFDTSNVTSMSSMFGYMDVPVIDISAMDMTNVVDTPFMFGVNPYLTTIYSEEAFALNPLCNSTNMFAGSPNIVGGLGTTVTRVDGTYAKVDGYNGTPGYFTYLQPVGTMLYDDGTLILNVKSADYLRNIQLHGAVKNQYPPAPYDLPDQWSSPWSGQRNLIKRVTLGEPLKPTTTAFWFSNLTECETIDLSRMDTSDVTDMQYMFNRCSSMKSVNVGHFDTSKVTNMLRMFADCYELEAVDVSTWDVSNVVTASSVFYDCHKLQALDVSNWHLDSATSIYYMFIGCEKLETLDCSNFGLANCTDIQGVFYNCYALHTLDISGWDTSNVTYMAQLFCFCRALRNVDLSSFDTEKVTNMEDMFMNCTTLTRLDLRSFDTRRVRDTTRMFDACTELRTIFASTRFTNSQITRAGNMFTDCTNLVGGNGTRYNARYVGAERAQLDTSTQQGYFTA